LAWEPIFVRKGVIVDGTSHQEGAIVATATGRNKTVLDNPKESNIVVTPANIMKPSEQTGACHVTCNVLALRLSANHCS
jgi:hypothetical protein